MPEKNLHIQKDASQTANMSKYEQAFQKYDLQLNDDAVKAAVEKLLEEKSAQYNTPEVLRYLLSTIELTTLTCNDSDESVLAMVEKYNKVAENHPDLPPFSALVTYPRFVDIVSKSLEVEGTKAACVVGGFPSSQTFIEIKTTETALSIKDGAEECDMVLSVGPFLQGDYETCVDEIEEIKAVCSEVPLKVILETGELKTAANIKRASILSMYAGADLIKTSTGKTPVSATPEAAYVMCQAIKEYYNETGRMVGFKASGGVSTPKDAVLYYTIVRELLGEEWIKAGLFRIGTSSLASRLLTAVTGEEFEKF